MYESQTSDSNYTYYAMFLPNELNSENNLNGFNPHIKLHTILNFLFYFLNFLKQKKLNFLEC
jgi:hypothetical protein